VLAGLRHHTLVRGNHEQGEIDPRRSSDHRVDKPLVSRHVDKVELNVVVGKLGKTEFDGDAAFAFFGQTITIGACKRLHQGRLAVVDVSRSSPHNVPHGLMVHGWSSVPCRLGPHGRSLYPRRVTDPRIETELKIPVADLATIRSRLSFLDAHLVSERKREVNLLLDTEERTLSRRGCVLRLRAYGDLRILTFKGPASYDGPIKVRPEHEVHIEDLEKMRRVFEALGFFGAARYEKDRETWRLGDAEIVLDHTPMGDFVEVEGPSELLVSVTCSLGLDPLHAVRGSYLSLWTDFRARNPEKNLPADMVFGT